MQRTNRESQNASCTWKSENAPTKFKRERKQVLIALVTRIRTVARTGIALFVEVRLELLAGYPCKTLKRERR